MWSSQTHPRIEQLNSLLTYLPEFRVVICTVCGFAVQPKALSSHLLRHHVYREKRRALLERLANLTLLEPDEVPLPSSMGPPIPHLPVALGHRCSQAGCNHLCISQKRMSQHLREQHGESQQQSLNAPQAYMQTFFKGNKVRYFEIVPDSPKAPVRNSPLLQSPVAFQFLNLYTTNQTDTETSVSSSGIESGQGAGEDVSISQHQMQDLMYLHHYTTRASLSMTRGHESSEFWSYNVPLQASTQPILMHGILGVAAFHQAWLTGDPDEQKMHRVAGLRYQSIGLNSFRIMINRPNANNSLALSAFARLLGVQCCGEALLEAETRSSQHNQDGVMGPRISQITELMLLLKGGLDTLLSMQGLLPSDSPLILPEDAMPALGDLEMAADILNGMTPHLVNEVCKWLTCLPTIITGSAGTSWPYYRTNTLDEVRDLVSLCLRASQVTDSKPDAFTTSWTKHSLPSTSSLVSHVEVLTSAIIDSYTSATVAYQSSNSGVCPILLCYPSIEPAWYSRLTSLPAKLFAIIAVPEGRELKAFNEAMAALVSSFSRSCAADSTWARWNGIESWPRMLSDHFLGMIEAAHPVALVLVAHWCVLLSQQEDSYWFLHGLSQRMLDIVLTHLDHDLQDFVRESISALA